jgi:phytoene dehydrogenase-like protein
MGDAAGAIDARGAWTDQVTKEYVDRILSRIEDQAPGLRSLILAQHVMTPKDLEGHNPNAVHGDPYGGSLELDQNLLWRPGPRTGRHRTAIGGLWHIGSSTHPGPGLGGASGHLAAQAIIAPSIARRAAARLRGVQRRTSP